MRSLAIPALLLASLAGLALTPLASAAPPAPSCNGTVGGSETFGPVTVFASPPCYTVEVRAMSCPISGHWEERRVADVLVRVYVCDGGPADDASSASYAPPCTCPPPQCNEVVTVGPLASIVSVTVSSDCRVRVDLLRIVACTSPLDGTWVFTQGRVTVTAPCKPDFDPCEPPFECYPESASAPQVPPVCIWREVEAGPAKAGFDQCRESHETTTCSNGSPQRIHHYEQVGPVYAQVHVCFPHSPPPPDLSAPASEPGPCGVQQRCPAPVPLCSGVKDPIEGPADVDVSPGCHVLVLVDVIDCLWGETWVYHTVGPATVGYTTCRSPDTMQAQPMADPFPTCVTEPCGPGAPALDACQLQSATPTSFGPTGLNLQRLVWGYDASQCDVDVEPIGACAPPSGETVERRIAFVHVTLLLCGGDVPDWS